MAISSLVRPEQKPKLPFDPGQTAELFGEVLGILGFVVDDAVRQELAKDTDNLATRLATAKFAGQAVTGEAVLNIPYSLLTTAELIEGIDSADSRKFRGANQGKKFLEAVIFHELWTPGTEVDSYTDEELGAASGKLTTVRFLVNNRLKNSNNKGDSAEPLLHFLGDPFDAKYAKDSQQTQLDKIAATKTDFQRAYPQLELRAASHREITVLGLMRRICGQPMPIEWGFMCDGNLPRKTVGGGSIVASVDSDGGQAYFDGGNGSAYDDAGVGLSAGLVSDRIEL